MKAMSARVLSRIVPSSGSVLRWGAAGVLGLLATACKTTIAAETLPFHVAIVPFEITGLGREVGEGGGSVGTLLLGFEGGEVAREFGALLDGLTFTDVTVLSFPPGLTAAEVAGWPRERRERHWIDAASACGADLLLLGEIELDPHVETSVVSSSLLTASLEGLLKAGLYVNFTPVGAGVVTFLSLLGWNQDQRTHVLRAAFDGSLLELGPLLDRTTEADLGNRRTQLLRSLEYETDLVSTFSDRQGWLGHVLSIFLPGGFFPSDRDVLARHLRESVAENVLAGLVEELEFRKRELLHGEGLFPFRVESLALARGAGKHVLSAEIALTTATIDAMDGYRLWIDGQLTADAGFGAPLTRERGLARYDLRVPLERLAPEAVLRLELRDGAPRQNVRTFTLRPERTGRRSERKLAIHLPSGPPPDG
jgi:hypothetical protein